MEPNDGYNRVREYKDVRGSEAARVDMGLESEPIRHKIITPVGSLDQSVPLKKKTFANNSRTNKTSMVKKNGNPLKKRVKLEKTEDNKLFADESTKNSLVDPEIKSGASNYEDSKSCLASSNHRIAKREKSVVGRNIPRSSVMTIWHWLRMRSRCTPTTRKKSSSVDHVQDPFLSLFIPAVISSDVNR